MIVLSIDPGSTRSDVSTTGIVLLDGVRLIDSWAVPDGINGFRGWGADNVYYDTLHHIAGVGPLIDGSVTQTDAVVCEQFVDRQVMGADRSPLLVEGAVRFLWPGVVLSPPSGKNTAVPDAILKKLGLWDFGTADHHNDRREAARHAIRYLKNQHEPDVLNAFR